MWWGPFSLAAFMTLFDFWQFDYNVSHYGSLWVILVRIHWASRIFVCFSFLRLGNFQPLLYLQVRSLYPFISVFSFRDSHPHVSLRVSSFFFFFSFFFPFPPLIPWIQMTCPWVFLLFFSCLMKSTAETLYWTFLRSYYSFRPRISVLPWSFFLLVGILILSLHTFPDFVCVSFSSLIISVTVILNFLSSISWFWISLGPVFKILFCSFN